MRLKLTFVMLCTLLVCACANQDTTPYPEQLAATKAASSMQQTRAEAQKGDKLAVFVLGGNWCHDSTDFAALVEDPTVQSWLDDRFTISLINVGYLDHIREYIEPYGVPVIYATPTVMVVEPQTNELLNRDSLSHWRNASSMDTQEVRRYFTRFTHAIEPAGNDSPALVDALASIDSFEQQQAQRIYDAYAVLGPMIAALDAGEPVPNFDKYWGNLAKMRSAMINDMAALRESAKRQDAEGVEEITLNFPSYSLFIDEV